MQLKSTLKCSGSLNSWLREVQDPNLFWYLFNENDQPLDIDNPEIEIEINAFKGRNGWGTKNVTIESDTNNLILFKGAMYNGILKGKIDPKIAHHPAWRSRLYIGIYDKY